jgi:hypothetical protein
MDQIWAEFKPDLDPCGAREHHYSAWLIEKNGGRFMDGSTPAMDGFNQPWHCRCAYMNPPYGKEIVKWINKARQEVWLGNAGMVVALVPARTDVRWWQDNVLTGVKRIEFDVTGGFIDRAAMVATQVRFLRGRLKFGDSKNSAPFPSAIVVWGGAAAKGEEGA